MSRWVLVIDDDPDIRDIVGLIVGRRGFDIVEAGDGFEALARLRERGAPALILLDLRMPGMSGDEFMSALRALEPGAATPPVVVISGDGSARQAAHDFGAAGFLSKPMELSALVDAVQRHAQV